MVGMAPPGVGVDARFGGRPRTGVATLACVIASFQHGFVFLKTFKTASTSIELALSPFCGPDDVLAPIGAPRWEFERQRLGALPQNFSRNPAVENRLRAAILAEDRQAIREVVRVENPQGGGCTAHMTAATIRQRVPPDFWDRAVKVSSERHPYEKAVSLAYFGFREADDFRAHLDEVVRNGEYVGFPIYSIDGKPVVDEWIVYDSLEQDVNRIAGGLGLPTPLALPRARSHQRADRTPATEVLNARQKRIIRRHCAAEFDLFGWER